MSDQNEYDVIVVGGGPLGLSTAYHLGKRNVKVLLLEQFTFLNQLGSSAGISRQFRIPYPEEYMVKLVIQSIPFWDELQSLTPLTLLHKVGTLWFGDPTVHTSEGNINEAKKAMDALRVTYQTLNPADLRERFRFRNLPETYSGIFQAEGASINLKAAIETLIRWNEICPHLTMKSQAPVSGITQNSNKFSVTTPLGSFLARKLILTPGPFSNSVFHLLDFHVAATYWNLTSAYYRISHPQIAYPTWFVFQVPSGRNGNEFYGFPEVPWDHPGYIRVASDFVVKPILSPGQRTFVPNAEELAFTSAFVREHMSDLHPVPEFTSTCLVALSKIPNKELLIDFAPPHVPNRENIVLCATGWAAKFVPIIGRILCDLALDGRTEFDISQFQTGGKYLMSISEARSRLQAVEAEE
jgi:glycine/D-amino acid oxidase-like deaminating enzyme